MKTFFHLDIITIISFLRYSNIVSGSRTAVFLFISLDKVENVLFKTVTAESAVARQAIYTVYIL